jgi:DNA repair protein RadC
MKNIHFTLKEMPISERPYEKCEKYGTGSLSDAELLAAIIRTGSKEERAVELAAHILNYSTETKGLAGLNYMTMEDLMKIHGIGKVKAIQILCITELTKRMAKATKETGVKLDSPDAVAEYYMQDMRHLTREELVLIMMDSKSKIIKDMIISMGSVNASIVAPREIYLIALKFNAVNIILLHNHPSGDPTPSKEDINITVRIKEAGTLIGIKLMDHIIIGDNRYVSLKEKGIL